ncbi:nucleotidyltransferase family protein [Swingsia samuiensis]|uniref:MobA-like NTP transferase domain-containing protein n=1 Tax=Swingsia samuiensis TaxID=1293412 RepID=A0A4Y6UMU9_9PROT|nr:nucleotidyltransferase family protein [Swingsia samuiensis]QDH17711.1 hypothetical protein E3D00_09135 [Swingsia samuiensis]
MKLPVLVLAGSRDGEHDPLAKLGGVSHKALLPIHGQSMLSRVLNALQAATELGSITVSIEAPDLIKSDFPALHILPSLPSPSESVYDGLKTLGTPCLITTADHALLRSEWISEFINNAPDCDLAAAIALKSTIERDVPHTKRTYIHLSDMTFSGCNLFLMKTDKASAVVALWKDLQKNRKHPLKMAKTLGWGTLLRALTRRLDSQSLYRRIEKLTGAKIRLVPLSDGRAAVDVDKPSDFYLVQNILSQRSL